MGPIVVGSIVVGSVVVGSVVVGSIVVGSIAVGLLLFETGLGHILDYCIKHSDLKVYE